MEFNINIWDEVVKWLHEQGKFTPEMLTEEPARNLIGETNRILSDAVHLSITEEVPPELTAQLEQNTYVFSAFKGYHNLKEASLKLTNDKGGIKPFETFKQDVLKVHKSYNVNYLEAEYNFAVQSAQMAVKWADYVADGDRYYLQYRTADDSKVRAEHAALHGTTLPVDDPFWDNYFPPLGWNCRCTAVQVRKDKYPVSDSTTAIQAGERATESKKQQIFRFNPGKEGKVFPPKHPYLPKGCEGCKKNNIRLAFSNANEKCSSCAYAQKDLQYEQNRKEYERLKNDPDYVDVEFDPTTGGLKGSHVNHHFDKTGGIYERHVQNAGFKTGYSVIFESEEGVIIGKRYTEGLWNGKSFEAAGRETGTVNNILRGLKHCAAKQTTAIAVLDFPNGGFNEENLKRAISKYRGLEKLKDGQYLRFEKIVCVQDETIVYEEDF